MPLTPSSFDSARLKVQRANRHIENLQATVSSFTAEKFYEFVVDGEPSALRARLLKPIPNELPFIIGDAVHNLKSALDYVITSILRDARVRGADLLFPFSKERKGLVNERTRLDPIERALAGAKRLILEEVQPYEGGDSNLYGLHALDKIDKHNNIIVLAAVAFANNFIVKNNGQVLIAARKIVFNVEDPIFLITNQVSVDYDSEASIQIRFGQGLPFGAEPVIPTLVQLSQRVSEVIELFAALV